MSSKTGVRVKTKPEEVQPSTSGGGGQPEQSEKEEQVKEGEESFDSDEIDGEFLDQYCEEVEYIQPMTISKELFYTNKMVTERYAKLSKEDQKRFDQMERLAKSIKEDTGDYDLIEDVMARVVGQRYGSLQKEDVKAIMGREGEGSDGGKRLQEEGGRLKIKTEPGAESEKVIISAIVPAEEPALLPYCVKGDEEEDCETISSVSDLEEIDKVEVQNVLKELAELKRKEADCLEKLVKAVPEMRDSEIVVVAEKVKETEVPPYVQDMFSHVGNPRDFRATLAAGERLLSQYKNHQAGTPLISIPELCILYDIGKTKLYEILRGGKYKYPIKEKSPRKR